MLKYLATNFGRNEIEAIGFDLDGTLYDEFEFISQLYAQLSRKISVLTGLGEKYIFKELSEEWLKSGNNASIFQDFLKKIGFRGDIESVVSMCVTAYRDFSPKLRLSPRMEFVLEQLADMGYKLFLISDGNCRLQRKKIESLGLYRFFAPENIAITGYYGLEYQKPSVKIIQNIKVLRDIAEPSRVIYAGDRVQDMQFALNAGFVFLNMKNAVCGEFLKKEQTDECTCLCAASGR